MATVETKNTFDGPDHANYKRCMEQLKKRINAIDEIIAGRKTTSYEYTNNEFICLQFRKIFELIILATFASHRHFFETLTTKLAKEWQIEKVVRIVEKKNPGFYPKPIDRVPSSKPGVKDDWVDVKSDFLRLRDLTVAHGRIGQAMHAINPYREDDALSELAKEFPLWREKTIRLLNNHLVEFPGKNTILYVGMQSAESGAVHTVLFEKQGDPITPPSA